jgi:hypothetical protein
MLIHAESGRRPEKLCVAKPAATITNDPATADRMDFNDSGRLRAFTRLPAMLLSIFLLVGCVGSLRRDDADAAYLDRALESFTVGSTREEVASVMGPPQRLHRAGLSYEIWYYGPSSITFYQGRVAEWENLGNNLKVHYVTSSEQYPFTPGTAPRPVRPVPSPQPFLR